MKRVFILLLVVALPLVSCRNSEVAREQLTEVGKVRSGDLDVVLLSPQPALRQGEDIVTIEFRAPDGSLADVGTVKGSATMPMAGMPPMAGSVEVQPTSTPGRYEATSDLGMVGEWRITVEWNGPAGRGSANFSSMVQ